ncbi:MAG: phosphonate C-P lyase system protein PhnG [Pseudomonadota bacterium]
MSIATETRKDWLSLLAKAPAEPLAQLWRATGLEPAFETLRAPEIGGVMARGRAGASGAPFNLGEITVTRCSVRLRSGEVGHSYVQGRDKEKAETVAVIDAAMQTEDAAAIRRNVLEPLAEEMTERAALRARKAAATKVDFFTMVRGED